jgi:hypothetical protein
MNNAVAAPWHRRARQALGSSIKLRLVVLFQSASVRPRARC